MNEIKRLRRSASLTDVQSTGGSSSGCGKPKGLGRRSCSETDLASFQQWNGHHVAVAKLEAAYAAHCRPLLSATGGGASDSMAVMKSAARMSQELVDVIARIEASALRSTREIVRLHRAQQSAELSDFCALQSRSLKMMETCHQAAMASAHQEIAALRTINGLLQREIMELNALRLRSLPMPSLENELRFIASTPSLQGLRWEHLWADKNLWAIALSGAVDLLAGSRARASLIERGLQQWENSRIVVVFDGVENSLSTALDMYELLRRGIKELRVALLYDRTSTPASTPAAVLPLGAYADSLRTRFARDFELNYFSGSLDYWRGQPRGKTAEERYWESRDDWRVLPHALWIDPCADDMAICRLHRLRARLEAAGSLLVAAPAHP